MPAQHFWFYLIEKYYFQNDTSETWFEIRFRITELRFLIYGLVFGIAITPVVFLIGFLAPVTSDLPNGLGGLILNILTFLFAVIISYRFILFAPLIVMGLDKPFRRPWSLSKGHALTVILIFFVPAIVEDYVFDGIRYLSEVINVTYLDLNVFKVILDNVLYLLIPAYTAMLLSLTYQHLSQDAAENTEFN